MSGKMSKTEDNMYCTTCRCEFVRWTGKCPVCKTFLIEKPVFQPTAPADSATYQSIVDTLRERGVIEVPMVTTEVARFRKYAFPYLGYGYAWAKQMHSETKALAVNLITVRVATDKSWSFPYQGRGFAWEQLLKGDIAGNAVSLKATRVGQDKTWGFPYLGYGFAWTEQAEGSCGDEIEVELSVTEIGREKRWSFPYFGFGFAWPSKGVLRLKVRE